MLLLLLLRRPRMTTKMTTTLRRSRGVLQRFETFANGCQARCRGYDPRVHPRREGRRVRSGETAGRRRTHHRVRAAAAASVLHTSGVSASRRHASTLSLHALLSQVNEKLDGFFAKYPGIDVTARMATLNSFLATYFPYWHFVGYYVVREIDGSKILHIGPYQGKVLATGAWRLPSARRALVTDWTTSGCPRR